MHDVKTSVAHCILKCASKKKVHFLCAWLSVQRNEHNVYIPPPLPFVQELKVAFARSRKVASLQAEALLSLAISLTMCRCHICAVCGVCCCGDMKLILCGGRV
jgi:hypothetical protein